MSFHRENFPSPENEDELIDRAYERAENLTTRNQISMSDFVDLYSSKNVESDLAYVKLLESKFEEENSPEEKERKRLAQILEAIVFEHGEQSDWFGSEATTIKASSFDDYVNGVDMITEFDEGQNRSSHAAFAVDITFSRSAAKKFEKIREKIDSGELAKVKYFQSKNIPFRGELLRVPITVVNAHPETVKRLAKLWIENDYKALANHWIQFQLLEELVEQCQIFADYADKVGQPQVAQSYRHIGEITKKIVERKNQTVKDTGQRDNNFYKTLNDLKEVLI